MNANGQFREQAWERGRICCFMNCAPETKHFQNLTLKSWNKKKEITICRLPRFSKSFWKEKKDGTKIRTADLPILVDDKENDALDHSAT